MADSKSPAARYEVRLAKECFTFSAAHFITYDGDTCEPLHGHNYRVTIEVAAPLDENAYVVDFIAVRDATSAITTELDHSVILPTEHGAIRVERSEQEVIARFGERRWVFPADECRLLPVPNTTAEQLARWIGERLLESLRAKGLAAPAELSVSVDECDGQIGVCRLTPR